LLGQGAFGQVWSALRRESGTEVAIKIVDKEMENSDIHKELMLQELEVLASISHPSITRTFELLHDDVNYYIVSEHVKGGDLMTRLKSKYVISEE
jgi:serine/threonine protein kinase